MYKEEVKNYQYIYNNKVYEKDVYRTSVDNLPCSVCAFGNKKNECFKPKDFNFSCGGFGYIKFIDYLE